MCDAMMAPQPIKPITATAISRASISANSGFSGATGMATIIAKIKSASRLSPLV
ncbi:MAG: hypothetical protein WA694_05680 [Pseudolabrys sp.]|jgi:hypothetical protein